MKKLILFAIFSFLLGSLYYGCKKDDPEPEPESPKEASDAAKFVYSGLASYYLWEDRISAFHNSKYNNEDSLNAFLTKYDDPEDLFYSLLYDYGKVDKWSFIVDDSKEIENWIAGISESMGMDFMMYYISETNRNLVGVIRYVYKNSPAAKAGLKRGDIFLTVNSENLTVSNYQTLLFTNKTYTLGLASFTGNSPVLNGKSVTMTAVLLQENPIHLDTIFNVNSTKVGYLVYNGFIGAYDSLINSSYDLELNKVFGKFKNAGIQKLILDLRYNGGGLTQTASYLASMIYSTDTKKVFSKMQLNNYWQDYYTKKYGDDYLTDFFSGFINKTAKTPETPINSLGLNQIYIISTSETASASEMVIAGLDPYINVVQVGGNTYGKYAGSFTIKDWIDNNGNVNPNHSYAMQPITFKNSNAQNFSDYVNGLVPDISVKEYASELLPFGDPNEPMLKACSDHIKGVKSAPVIRGTDLRSFKSSDDFSPMGRNMVREIPKINRE
jgi:C-terminal processing protease CtpA/Prc